MSVHYFWRYEHFFDWHFHFLWCEFVDCSRNLWTTQKHFHQYHRTRWIFFKPDFLVETGFKLVILSTMNPIIWIIIIITRYLVWFRGICYEQQNQKNENGAQKNFHIFKSNAPALLKLVVGFYISHVYKGLDFFKSCCVMSSWNKTTCNSQNPTWPQRNMKSTLFEVGLDTFLALYTTTT